MRRLILTTVVVLGLAASSATAAIPDLHVVGNQLIDDRTGQVFVPRGANWPSFEYACVNGYYHDDEAGGSVNPDAAGAAVIASWHINTVRIPLNESCWLGVDGYPNTGDPDAAQQYRDAVADWVWTLYHAGIAVVLDLHWSAPAGYKPDGQRAMPDARAEQFWKSVAKEFKENEAAIFDLFNEPYSRYDANDNLVFDLTWSCLRDGGCKPPVTNDQEATTANTPTYTAIGMQKLVDAVRSTGATQPIMVAGRDYANDLGQWLGYKPSDGALVASFHSYETQRCHTSQCFDAEIAPIAAQVPVVVSEFGDTDCSDGHMNNLMNWSDAHGVGYLAWAWWVLKPGEDPGCQALALLKDARGTPRAPNGTALKAHLDALAAAGVGSGAGTAGGTSSTPGTTGSGTGSTTGTGSTGSSSTTKTRVSLGGKRTQRLGRSIAITVTCNLACTARAAGSLRITIHGKRKRYRLRSVKGLIAAGRIRELKLGIPTKARRAARAALRRKRRVTAAITVTAGGVTTKRTITLKR